MRKAMAVASKELRQILRDRRTLLILLFVPAFFLLLYGYALNFDIRNVRWPCRTRIAARRAASWCRRSSTPATSASSATSIRRPRWIAWSIEGQVRAILSIPSGFERDLSLRQPVDVQVIIDGDNANTASTVMGYARTLDRRVQLARRCRR